MPVPDSLTALKRLITRLGARQQKKEGNSKKEKVNVSKDGLLQLLWVVDHALRALGIVEPIRARRHHPAHAHDAPNWLHGVRLRC
jgi:hypothetical protein